MDKDKINQEYLSLSLNTYLVYLYLVVRGAGRGFSISGKAISGFSGYGKSVSGKAVSGEDI